MEQLASLLESLTGGQALEQIGVMNAWHQVAGPPLRRKTRVLQLRDGVLFVGVSSAAWVQELTFQKHKLRRRLNESLGREAVEEIRFRAGVDAVSQAAGGGEDGGEGEAWGQRPAADVELSGEDRRRLDEVSETIDDPELRQAFRRWLSTEMRWQKSRSRLGWQRCPLCGVLHPGEGSCPICAPGDADPSIEPVVSLLADAPFLSLEQVRQRLEGAQETAYRRAKQWLRDYWSRAVRQEAAELLTGINTHGWGEATLKRESQGMRLLLGSLVMLEGGISPETLEPDDLRRQLVNLELGGLAPVVLSQPDNGRKG